MQTYTLCWCNECSCCWVAWWKSIAFYICPSVYWCLLWAPSNLWMAPSFSVIPSSPSQIPCCTIPVILFVSIRAKYLKVHLCCITVKAMKMSRRSADASQRALAYSRMVDGLNEFRLGNNSQSPAELQMFYNSSQSSPLHYVHVDEIINLLSNTQLHVLCAVVKLSPWSHMRSSHHAESGCNTSDIFGIYVIERQPI